MYATGAALKGKKKKKKRQKKAHFLSLLKPRDPLLPSWTSVPLVPGPPSDSDQDSHYQSPNAQDLGLGLTPSISSGLQTGLNHTTSFPGSPANRWQMVELLSFHSHVSPFL